MCDVGFSTGALAKGDVDAALAVINDGPNTSVIEFSALRWEELEPVARYMVSAELSRFRHVSFHAPSSFDVEQEPELIRFLKDRVPERALIVIHPDVLHDVDQWAQLGPRLAIENMDKRKPSGRTVEELRTYFARLPEARFCFDVGHARQCDPSMTEAYRMLREFGDRLAEVHVSEVGSDSGHGSLSMAAITAFREIAAMVPDQIPFIVEGHVLGHTMAAEVARVREAFAGSCA